MDNTQTICLLNDSFPPLIDGVANTVVNYAKHLPEVGLKSLVITPDHNDAEDQKFDYPVIRYPSIKTQMVKGYPAGVPFPRRSHDLRKQKTSRYFIPTALWSQHWLQENYARSKMCRL